MDDLPAIVSDTVTDFHIRDPETFFASQIGFCRRQLYLPKFGLMDATASEGQFRAGRLIREYSGEQLGNRYPPLELEANNGYRCRGSKIVRYSVNTERSTPSTYTTS